MKKIILVTMLLSLVACSSPYIEVIDVNDGKYLTIRDQKHYTKVKDTLIIASNVKAFTVWSLYGKYLGNMPESVSVISYRKVVRIK
jgi:hypothetical protein